MLRIALQVGVLSLVISVHARADQAVRSYAAGNAYLVAIKDKDVKSAPKWTKEQQQPALSPRKAMEVATRATEKVMKDNAGYEWEIAGLALTPYQDDHWFWIVSFRPTSKSPSTGNAGILKVVVLMDGTAPEVTIELLKR